MIMGWAIARPMVSRVTSPSLQLSSKESFK